MSNNIAVYNFKGGVGKTTTTLNLGYGWSKHFKVLLIDCDPQCNLSNVLHRGTTTNNLYTILKQLLHDQTPHIAPIEITPYLHLIPGNYQMVENESNSQYITFGSEILHKLFSHIRKEYDLIILDCPTNFGVLVKSILQNIDSILIPTVPDTFSVTGVQTLMKYLNTLDSPKPINILGIFFNMYNKNLIQNAETFRLAQALFGNIIINTTISQSIRVREATSQGLPILHYQSENPAARDFDILCEDLLGQLFAFKTLDENTIMERLKNLNV